MLNLGFQTNFCNKLIKNYLRNKKLQRAKATEECLKSDGPESFCKVGNLLPIGTNLTFLNVFPQVLFKKILKHLKKLIQLYIFILKPSVTLGTALVNE
jgi:hypothetical protein